MTLDKAAFFKTVRAKLGSLTQSQSDGIETILSAIAGGPLAYQAYMLATAWHETATTMQPIKERGGPEYLRRMYDVTGSRPDMARKMGNTAVGDGVKYCGRGYVQLTWKSNYAKAAKAVGADLIGNPGLAMKPGYAATIMLDGMKEGWFTGKKLSSYLPSSGVATHDQYVNARRIINGTDKSELIEDYAQAFEHALRDAGLA